MDRREPTPQSTVQTVSISSSRRPVRESAAALSAPSLAVPKLWLGAESAFGLALPSAQPSASTMYAPRGVWLDDQRLIVCDSGNHRVLIWNNLPTDDHVAADVVLGQPDFASEGPAAGGRGPENGLHLPTGVLVIDGRLVVADAWHHRLLVWNAIPTASDSPPDYAIGQPDLNHVTENRGDAIASLNGLYWPYGIGWHGQRLYVADTGNRRILVWDGFPEMDRPADRYWGQSATSGSEENRGGPVAANSFRWPHDFAITDERLYVADAGNHRVLCWHELPQGDQAADALIGQRDFDSAFELPYDTQGSARLRFPYALDDCRNVLAVADTANNRIMFWRIPLADPCGGTAFDVAGQVDFSGNGENRWEQVRRDTLCWPYGVSFHNGSLAIADSGNNRVMIWDCQRVLQYAEQLADHDQQDSITH